MKLAIQLSCGKSNGVYVVVIDEDGAPDAFGAERLGLAASPCTEMIK
jgi:hypothetical protein